jgi:hypothetical protein
LCGGAAKEYIKEASTWRVPGHVKQRVGIYPGKKNRSSS